MDVHKSSFRRSSAGTLISLIIVWVLFSVIINRNGYHLHLTRVDVRTIKLTQDLLRIRACLSSESFPTIIYKFIAEYSSIAIIVRVGA